MQASPVLTERMDIISYKDELTVSNECHRGRRHRSIQNFFQLRNTELIDIHITLVRAWD